MLQMQHFDRDDVFPSWFANALTRALSLAAFQFEITVPDATHIQVPAAADAGAAVVSIAGLWRWVEASLTVAHPGGSAGVYPVFVTAKNNDVEAAPLPYTDDTDYAFRLAILAPGATPTIVAGTVDVYLHVGDVHWSGAAITRVDQLVPGTASHAGRHAAGGADPLAPADIAAASSADLTAEASSRATADAAEASARIAADAAEASARATADTARVLTPAAAGVGSSNWVPVSTGGGAGYAWAPPPSKLSRAEHFGWAQPGAVLVGGTPGAWVSLAAGESAILAKVFGKVLAGTATVELHRLTWAGVDTTLATMNLSTTAVRSTPGAAVFADSDFLYLLITAVSSDASGLSLTATVERTF